LCPDRPLCYFPFDCMPPPPFLKASCRIAAFFFSPFFFPVLNSHIGRDTVQPSLSSLLRFRKRAEAGFRFPILSLSSPQSLFRFSLFCNIELFWFNLLSFPILAPGSTGIPPTDMIPAKLPPPPCSPFVFPPPSPPFSIRSL